MRPRAILRKPGIITRRLISLVVRTIAITSMSFAVAFGFLSGATSPMAHYDPNSFAIGVATLLRRRLRGDWNPHLPHPTDEGGAARARKQPRTGGRPQLGNQRSAGARQKLLRGAGRRHRAPRRQPPPSPMPTTRSARSPDARARNCSPPRLRFRSRSKAKCRASPTARAFTTRRSQRRKARAGSPGARSQCAPTAAAKCKASAAT